VSTVWRRERKTVYVEHVVPAADPWHANWVEVMKAISACTAELREAGLLGETQEPSDERIRMRVEDEAIVVYYEKVEVTR
jgi:hypothetical protein